MEEKKTNLLPLVLIELLIIAVLIGALIYTMTNEHGNKCDVEPPKVEEKTEKSEEQPEPNQPEKESIEQKQEQKEPVEQKPEEKQEQKQEPKPSNKQDNGDLPVVTAFKEFYQKQGFADKSNIEKWTFTTAKETSNKNYKGYYEFSGFYQCKDNSSDCVYLEQVEEPMNGKNIYGFIIFAKVTEKNGQYTFTDLRSHLD